MWKLIIPVFLMWSCGSQDGNQSLDTAQNSEEKTVTNIDGKEEVFSIISESSKKPECLEGNDSQLIYVADTEEFQACQALSWITIDIKGKDGVDGKDGQDGETTILSNTEWIDPVDGKKWFITGPFDMTVKPCAAPYRMPTAQELTSAIYHGLTNGLAPTKDAAWHKDSPSSMSVGGGGYYSVVLLPSGEYGSRQSSSPQQVYCMNDQNA